MEFRVGEIMSITVRRYSVERGDWVAYTCISNTSEGAVLCPIKICVHTQTRFGRATRVDVNNNSIYIIIRIEIGRRCLLPCVRH